MDIKQIRYFVTIVECGCNLSKAAKKIHISQPALSKMIKEFEKKENALLLDRSAEGFKLTPAGERFFRYAQSVVKQYDEMMAQLREDATKLTGKIKIGIPPLIISALFSKVLSNFIIENLDVKVEVVEVGAYELKKKLILQEIDIAILLKPTTLCPESFEEVLLVQDTLCTFMDQNNPLSIEKTLSWSQLDGQPMAIFDRSFMIHHQVMQEFERRNIRPDILITSAYWDYLLQTTIKTDLITILPSPIADYFLNAQIAKVEIQDPILWDVVLCRHKKESYSPAETYMFDHILHYFCDAPTPVTEKGRSKA